MHEILTERGTLSGSESQADSFIMIVLPCPMAFGGVIVGMVIRPK
jgi:predicted transporter